MYEDAIRFRAKHRKAWGNVEPKTSLRRGGRMGDMKANLIAVARTRLQKELLYLERMFEDAGEKDAYRFLIATISHDKDYWQYGGPSDEEIERLNKALMILGIIFKEGRRARIR
jgi:hypothetical protein